jgi:peptide deformylase
MTIPVPGEELPVVQQTRDAAARHANPLYLPARCISKEEFASPELGALVSRMREVMRVEGGIGIAANQIGLSLQIFLLEARPDNPRYQVLGEVPFSVFVNPRITRASKERRNFWHGCLSARNEARGNLATYEWIEFEALDVSGTPKMGRLEGLAAVIFQHELRHLLGGTYLDKARTLLPKAELDERLEKKELPFFEPVGEELPLLLDDYRIGETLEEFYSRTSRG